jgi:hypothetical protein
MPDANQSVNSISIHQFRAPTLQIMQTAHGKSPSHKITPFNHPAQTSIQACVPGIPSHVVTPSLTELLGTARLLDDCLVPLSGADELQMADSLAEQLLRLDDHAGGEFLGEAV